MVKSSFPLQIWLCNSSGHCEVYWEISKIAITIQSWLMRWLVGPHCVFSLQGGGVTDVPHFGTSYLHCGTDCHCLVFQQPETGHKQHDLAMVRIGLWVWCSETFCSRYWRPGLCLLLHLWWWELAFVTLDLTHAVSPSKACYLIHIWVMIVSVQHLGSLCSLADMGLAWCLVETVTSVHCVDIPCLQIHCLC